MLSLEEIRQNLPQDEEFTDEQVKEICDSLYELANICFDTWLIKRKTKL